MSQNEILCLAYGLLVGWVCGLITCAGKFKKDKDVEDGYATPHRRGE